MKHNMASKNSKQEMSEAEKKERKETRRINNNEHCRKSRKKVKEENKEMAEIFNSNEKRLQSLEKMALKLSKELNSHPSSSAHPKK